MVIQPMPTATWERGGGSRCPPQMPLACPDAVSPQPSPHAPVAGPSLQMSSLKNELETMI